MKTTECDKDMTCPVCGHVLASGSLIGEGSRDGGLTLREVIGCCAVCGRSFDLIQVRDSGRWIGHKYRAAEAEESFGEQWIVCGPLPAAPAPPILMTGTGGAYTCPVSAEELDRKCRQCDAIIRQCLEVIGKIVGVKHWIQKQQL